MECVGGGGSSLEFEEYAVILDREPMDTVMWKFGVFSVLCPGTDLLKKR